MTHTFKIRYANVLVGSLVFFVLALLIVGTAFIGAKKKWFKNPFTLQAELPFRRSLGLKIGTAVYLMDSDAGEVTAMEYHRNGHITATLTFKEVFKNFIRTNAVGIVRKEFGVVGEQRIMLSQKEEGPTFADIPQENPMPIEPDVDVVSALLKTADKISADVPVLVAHSSSTISNVMVLTSQLSDPQKGVQPAIVEATALLKRVRETLEVMTTGKGFAAKALNDPAFAQSIQKIMDELASTLQSVRTTLGKVQVITDSLPPVLAGATGTMASVQGTLASVKNLTEDARPLMKTSNDAVGRIPQLLDHADVAVRQLPSTLLQAQAALEELQTLLQGLQHNWLLKGGVEEAKKNSRPFQPTFFSFTRDGLPR